MKIELLSASQLNWGKAPDLYFTGEYGVADAIAQSGEWRTIVALDGAWQLPIVIRELSNDLRDGTSPYGYSGVFADPGLSKKMIDDCWIATRKTLKEMGIVSLFLRHSPLVNQPIFPADGLQIVAHHKTRYVPLDTEENVWRNMEGRSRTSVRKARKFGLKGSHRPCQREDTSSSSAFRRLYESTMWRRDAPSSYLFADDYYDSLLEGLKDHLSIAYVNDEDGVILSAAMFMTHGNTIHYHLSGSTPAGDRLGAANLLLWETLQTATRAGLSGAHLGGGLRDGDSLYKFKRSFGGEDRNFSASGLIINSDAYRRLSPGDTSNAFFPAYRRLRDNQPD